MNSGYQHSGRPLSLFAATAPGLEPLLERELLDLGAEGVEVGHAGVAFRGDLATAYRACLWSRTATRVLLHVAAFSAKTPEELYEGAKSIRWDEHLAPEGTLAVDFNAARSRISHTHFGALKVKDAVVDQMRELYGVRPSVETERPDLRINLYLLKNEASLSLDLSGESLHRRGYRERGVAAPLKENLAAAILLFAGWPEVAKGGGGLVDPMCGSGTLPIEAALMAADIAPGLTRTYFGFQGWRGHDEGVWKELIDEALERRDAGLRSLPPVVGYDVNPRAVEAALANVERADLRGRIIIERRDVTDAAAVGDRPGLVVVNPPYGERIGAEQGLPELYAALGRRLKEAFGGWQGAIFTGNPPLARHLGVRPRRDRAMRNGAIECRLLSFQIEGRGGEAISAPAVEGDHPFANRLRKNLGHLGKWARRNGVDCYRVYDADLPEYALAVDLYQGEGRWVHVQEYEAPATVDPAKADRRLAEALALIPGILEIPEENLFLKVRRRQKGVEQYEKLGASGRFFEVREGRCLLWVNLSDYLDTGLFLDHRTTRQMVEDLAEGRSFLNLFCYTGSATVHAAVGGARSTTSVDMSATYLGWAERNMALNGCTGVEHRYIQADCVQWLEEEVKRGPARQRYDLIFLDPPTFSNSKRMEGTFDVQRDHVELLYKAAKLLEEEGLIIFSTNNRRFKPDLEALKGLKVEEITQATIPEDFKRNPRIHHCYLITWKEGR